MIPTQDFKILIVDDSEMQRFALKAKLRKLGYRLENLTEAENGKHALEELERSAFDLILSDWNMPEMSGLELLEILRKQKPHTPFGIVTALDTQLNRKQALDAGASFILNKPFDFDLLKKTLQDWFSNEA